MKYMLAAIGCIGMMSGCKANPENGAVIGEPPMVDGQLIIRGAAFGRPASMLVRGDYLWVVDAAQDPFVHLVELGTGNVAQSIGRRGEGPGEFRGLQAVMADPSDSLGVIGFDTSLRRLMRMSVGDDGVVDVVQVGRVPDSPVSRRITLVGDKFIGWLTSEDSRWMSFDYEGVVKSIEPGPLLGPDSGIAHRERVKASSAMVVCARPSGGRYAVLYVDAARVEIHDEQGRLVRLANVPEPTNGNFESRNGGDVMWYRDRYHYQGCTASDGKFFALYSGKPFAIGIPGGFEGDLVEVYSWDGKLLGRFQTSVQLLGIAVGHDESELFGAAADDAAIYRFRLPSHD